MLDLKIVGERVWVEGAFRPAEIGIEGGIIARVGDAVGAARETLDAGAKAVLPGLIDTQVHFREPGLTHKETIATGSAAAVAGGVTTYFEMPNTAPVTTTRERLEEKLRIAAATSWADFAFFVGAARENLDGLAELELLPGAAGIKIFMGSSTGPLLLDGEDDLLAALRNGRRRVSCHCEDEARNRRMKGDLPEGGGVEWHPRLRDAESARLATERYLRAGAEARRPVHVLHVSTADEIPLLREAKARGQDATCEVTPQHLRFSSDDYPRLGTRLQQNPPIRSPEHRDALRAALAEGLFDVFGSDHAPHTPEEKARPYPESPSGMPGVQTSLPVLLSLGVGLETIARMFCETPARLFGIERKGHLREGYDADLIVVEEGGSRPFRAEHALSGCGWSPFEGEALPLGATRTIVGGRLVWADGRLRGEPGAKVAGFAPVS